MSVIQQAVIEKAAKMLSAAGLKFAIQLPEGGFDGDLQVKPAIEKTGRKPRQNLRQFGYIEQVRAMNAGEAKRFPTPAEVAYVNWSSSISAAGTAAFGAGNFMVAAAPDRSYCEALRVE
jgi:hypothetical protein